MISNSHCGQFNDLECVCCGPAQIPEVIKALRYDLLKVRNVEALTPKSLLRKGGFQKGFSKIRFKGVDPEMQKIEVGSIAKCQSRDDRLKRRRHGGRECDEVCSFLSESTTAMIMVCTYLLQPSRAAVRWEGPNLPWSNQ